MLRHLSIALLLCALNPWPSRAEVHEVTVRNFEFVPNDITIAPGDTVRWRNTQGLHDVRADDGSYGNSASSTAWTFEHTFNQAGESFYHCSVHSSPGRDINLAMNGRIVVEAATSFVINPGLSGTWWNPDQSGQGMLIDVIPDTAAGPGEGSIFFAWFAYDTELPPGKALPQGNQRWFTAFGPYSANLAVLDAVFTEGGVLGSGEPAPTHTIVGTIEMEFLSCTEAEFRYDMPGLGISGSTTLQKFLGDVLCESLNEAAVEGGD